LLLVLGSGERCGLLVWGRRDGGQRSIEGWLRLLVSAQQFFQAMAQFGITGAFALQKHLTLGFVGYFEGGGEQFFDAAWLGGHGKVLR
jgi:hypothetical protein